MSTHSREGLLIGCLSKGSVQHGGGARWPRALSEGRVESRAELSRLGSILGAASQGSLAEVILSP